MEARWWLCQDAGPCKDFQARWFYNAAKGHCESFQYGGCAGNRNHFYRRDECEIHCARQSKPPCLAPSPHSPWPAIVMLILISFQFERVAFPNTHTILSFRVCTFLMPF